MALGGCKAASRRYFWLPESPTRLGAESCRPGEEGLHKWLVRRPGGLGRALLSPWIDLAVLLSLWFFACAIGNGSLEVRITRYLLQDSEK